MARTFIMSGAHRDANNAPCDCVTGPNYSEADAAHSTEHGFHAAVEATLAHYEGLGEDYTAFQFHGMGESTCPGVDVYLRTAAAS